VEMTIIGSFGRLKTWENMGKEKPAELFITNILVNWSFREFQPRKYDHLDQQGFSNL